MRTWIVGSAMSAWPSPTRRAADQGRARGNASLCAGMMWRTSPPQTGTCRAATCFPFQELKWETVRLPGSAAPQPRFDVVELDKVIRGVCIQPHPSQEDAFFFNRYV